MDGQTMAPQMPPQASGGNLKKILIIVGIVVGVLVALGAGIFFLVYSLTKGPADAAEQFLRDISAGQVEKAYGDTAGLFKQYTSLADFQSAITQNAVLPQIQDISLPNRSIENSDAAVSGTITSKNGITVEVSVSLQKENDAWKVTSMEVGGVIASQEQAGADTGSEEAAAGNDSAAQGEGVAPETGAPISVASAGMLPAPPKEGQGIFVQAFENATEGNRFDIYDATGKNKLDSYQPVNTFIDLGPGTYTLYRYGNQKVVYASQVVVQPQRVTTATISAIALAIPVGVEEGTRFDVYDATGKEKLESYQPGNTIISFGPGTYTLYRYGNNRVRYAQQMVVSAGNISIASIGAIQLNGSSRYDIYDGAGVEKLESYQPQNVPVAFALGAYVLKKYGTALELARVTVTPEKITVAP